MSWIDNNKDSKPWKGGGGPWEKNPGPWDFAKQSDKWGYLNNPRWSEQPEARAFCEKHDLPLDLTGQHLPCGHWHKAMSSEKSFSAGKMVAAMQQLGTPYIYVYDILGKAVIQIDTSVIPIFISGRLELDSTYGLDYDMGFGNPGAQKGGYCMNKDGTRIWYLFTEQMGDRSDAELIEVDISGACMAKVKSTLFPNLVPSDPAPGGNERIMDGCSDNVHTYWCTNLIAGRIIKIRNSDHVIVDDHHFNWDLGGKCSEYGEGANTIDIHSDTLYWNYALKNCPPQNACVHCMITDTNFGTIVDKEYCGSGAASPFWQNMVRVYNGYFLQHRAYHPFCGVLEKKALDACPRLFYICQEYLQNIFGVIDGKLFTLMHVNSISHPAYLYCINFSDMSENSKLAVNYYTGQGYWPNSPYDWGWTSVSAMNHQTGVIAIFRYNYVEEKNYVGCFRANSDFDFLCDVPIHTIKYTNEPMISGEPQIWTMPK